MNDAVCATCGNRAERPAREGDPTEWKRAPEGWCTGADSVEFCSIACLDARAKPLPPPPGSKPCSQRRALQPCETPTPAPLPSPVRDPRVRIGLAAFIAAACASVDLGPPPRPRRR